MVYYTADLHLGHKGIIALCNRPFKKIEEMDEVLIRNWNKKVKKNDTVYIVGDFVWKNQDVQKYLQQLSGKKILIVGNHDKWFEDKTVSEYFLKIAKYDEISLEGHPITFCHYPMLEWKNSRKIGTSRLGYLIFGHIHNKVLPEYKPLFSAFNALNAGVDVNHFEPVSFAELVKNNEEFSKTALEQLAQLN